MFPKEVGRDRSWTDWIQLRGCHGPCPVTFFLKNNQRMALTESPMMATSPLFSATITTGHLRQTYIGAPSEYFPYSNTTNTTCILIIVITNQHHVLSQHNQSPTMLHTRSMFQANHITHAPVLEVMSRGHHKDLRGFRSASFGTIQNTSLLIICSFYYHMLFTITPYMFMFCFCINTPVCCMYFASLNINLATYFSLTHSCLLKLLLGSTLDSPTPSRPPKFEASIKRVAQPTSWSQRLARLRTQHLRPNSELNSIFKLNLSCYGNTRQEEDPSVIQHYARRIFDSRILWTSGGSPRIHLLWLRPIQALQLWPEPVSIW